jgi:LacI family transcriptional regulator
MRKATLLDIAEKANVSKTTVSMVLNNNKINVSDATRQKIYDVAKELNYIPNTVARSLSTRKTETIGIVLPDIENPFFSEMARAIEDTAGKLNYNIMFCNTDNNQDKEEKYVKLLISKLVDGVIFVSGGKSEQNLQMLENNNVPFVIVDRYIESSKEYNGVFCDNEEGIRLGVEYLHKNNKKKIAFVTGAQKLKVAKLRLEAFEEVTKKLNIYNEHLIFEGEFTINGGMKATEYIMNSSSTVDAIFYSNDVMALGGLKILTRKGYKIPEDIAIMGYDNINISNLVEPELTTVAQPIYNMGEEACKLLVGLINGSRKEELVILKPKLVIRGTV